MLELVDVYAVDRIPDGPRYRGWSPGCGCCAGSTQLSIEDCRKLVTDLEGMLKTAKAALVDMEANGERF